MKKDGKICGGVKLDKTEDIKKKIKESKKKIDGGAQASPFFFPLGSGFCAYGAERICVRY